jgi:hypothetical protein
MEGREKPYMDTCREIMNAVIPHFSQALGSKTAEKSNNLQIIIVPLPFQ